MCWEKQLNRCFEKGREPVEHAGHEVGLSIYGTGVIGSEGMVHMKRNYF